MGIVLEQLLLHTELSMVIFDPNADYVRLPEVRDGAALLQLDPIADAEQYNVLLHAEVRAEGFDLAAAVARIRSSDDPGQVRLSYRMENLQVLEWALWSRGGNSVVDVLDERPRATVFDLGGFSHPAESRVTALAGLGHLWGRRAERRPLLIVIDEAHNLCSPEPQTDVERVLTQCDNLVLMRVNSPRDLADLAEVLEFAGHEQIQRSSSVTQGQALFAGGFVAEASFVQRGKRVGKKSSGDVTVSLRGNRETRRCVAERQAEFAMM